MMAWGLLNMGIPEAAQQTRRSSLQKPAVDLPDRFRAPDLGLLAPEMRMALVALRVQKILD